MKKSLLSLGLILLGATLFCQVDRTDSIIKSRLKGVTATDISRARAAGGLSHWMTTEDLFAISFYMDNLGKVRYGDKECYIDDSGYSFYYPWKLYGVHVDTLNYKDLCAFSIDNELFYLLYLVARSYYVGEYHILLPWCKYRDSMYLQVPVSTYCSDGTLSYIGGTMMDINDLGNHHNIIIDTLYCPSASIDMEDFYRVLPYMEKYGLNSDNEEVEKYLYYLMTTFMHEFFHFIGYEHYNNRQYYNIMNPEGKATLWIDSAMVRIVPETVYRASMIMLNYAYHKRYGNEEYILAEPRGKDYEPWQVYKGSIFYFLPKMKNYYLRDYDNDRMYMEICRESDYESIENKKYQYVILLK